MSSMVLLAGLQSPLSKLPIARIALFIVGVGLFITARLLNEPEEEALHGRLSAWWVRLDDLSQGMLAAESNFIKTVSRAMSTMLDDWFGHALVSLRAITVSVSLSYLGAAFVWVIVAVRITPRAIRVLGNDLWILFSLYVAILITLVGVGCFGLLKARKRQKMAAMVVIGITISMAILLSFLADTPSAQIHGLEQFSVAFTISVATDLVLVVVIRMLLRKAASSKVGIALFLDFTAFISTLWPVLIALRVEDPERFGDHVQIMLLYMNASDVLLLSVLFVAGGILVLNHMAWPAVKRPLYALQRMEISEHKKLLHWLGIVALIGSIVIGRTSITIWDFVKGLVKL
jgi:hypothetical protein